MRTLREEGKKAFIWDFMGKIATHGMSFIVTIFLARLLEPSDFGLIAMIMVIISIAMVFTDIGLGSALIQRKQLSSLHYSSVFYFNIIIGLILTLITYFSAAWISNFYNNQNLLPLIQVMSLLFLINSTSALQSTRLRKELNYALLTKIGLSASFISGLVGIYAAYSGLGVWSLVIQSLLMGIVYTSIIWFKVQWKPSLEFSWKALTELWGFGFRMFMIELIDTLYSRLDYIIIGKLFAPATLGFYQRAKSLNLMIVQYSSGSLMSVLFPILSKIQHDTVRFQAVVVKAYGIILFISFLLFASLFLVSEELIIGLYSDKWLASVLYFKILALSSFMYPISALLVNILSSRGNSKAFLRMAIYKKVIAFSNFGILFLFGINAFLYGLILVAFININITIFVAAKEANLMKIIFYKPLLIEGLLTLISFVLTKMILYMLVHNLTNIHIILFLIKLILFFFFFFFFHYLFKTSSYLYFLEEFIPVYKKFKQKLFEMRN